MVLLNLFGIEAAKKMMSYKFDEKEWPVIKPILLYLNYITDSENIEIPLDPFVVERLRKI